MYFEREGRENTTHTIQAALAAAKAQDIGNIVVASATGATICLDG